MSDSDEDADNGVSVAAQQVAAAQHLCRGIAPEGNTGLVFIATLDGPVNSPYEGTQVLFRFKFPSVWPENPENYEDKVALEDMHNGPYIQCRTLAYIFHPNFIVGEDVCLKCEWSTDEYWVDITLSDVIEEIQMMLSEPNSADHCCYIPTKFWGPCKDDPVLFRERAAEWSLLTDYSNELKELAVPVRQLISNLRWKRRQVSARLALKTAESTRIEVIRKICRTMARQQTIPKLCAEIKSLKMKKDKLQAKVDTSKAQDNVIREIVGEINQAAPRATTNATIFRALVTKNITVDMFNQIVGITERLFGHQPVLHGEEA